MTKEFKDEYGFLYLPISKTDNSILWQQRMISNKNITRQSMYLPCEFLQNDIIEAFENLGIDTTL